MLLLRDEKGVYNARRRCARAGTHGGTYSV
jgi:hypothetical protein